MANFSSVRAVRCLSVSQSVAEEFYVSSVPYRSSAASRATAPARAAARVEHAPARRPPGTRVRRARRAARRGTLSSRTCNYSNCLHLYYTYLHYIIIDLTVTRIH